jgi:hypothetical protein
MEEDQGVPLALGVHGADSQPGAGHLDQFIVHAVVLTRRSI